MTSNEKEIIKKHLSEIIKYQAVLSNILKRKVTVEQAIADWIEKGFHNKFEKN